MTYEDLLNHIYKAYPMYHKIGKAAYKEGLENIEELMTIVQHPEAQFKSIHIAGTNGKGSVAHLLASFFQELGWKTGLFTSPHLVDFRERIKINGSMIPKEGVISFFNTYQMNFDTIEPSFFEMTTALAYHYFAKQQVDIAIIEVGLGGRLDCTNVITPILSVITNISLEHTQLLGDTLSKIAYEKGGIIKTNVPVVIGEYQDEPYKVFQQLAEQHHAALFLADKNYHISEDYYLPTGFVREISIADRQNNILLKQIKLPLTGDYELKNVITFYQATQLLKSLLVIDKEVISQAIENVITNTHFYGRWQILDHQPLTICDAGHNPGGLALTMQQLATLPYRRLHFVVGFVNDKDISTIFTFLPKDAIYYVCKADLERAIPASSLSAMMKEYGFHVIEETTVEKAWMHAKQNAIASDVIFIGGSCFVVGEIIQVFKNQNSNMI